MFGWNKSGPLAAERTGPTAAEISQGSLSAAQSSTPAFAPLAGLTEAGSPEFAPLAGLDETRVPEFAPLDDVEEPVAASSKTDRRKAERIGILWVDGWAAMCDPNGSVGLAGVLEGDIVKSINGFDCSNFHKWYGEHLDEFEPGEVWPIVIQRGGCTMTLRCTLLPRSD